MPAFIVTEVVNGGCHREIVTAPNIDRAQKIAERLYPVKVIWGEIIGQSVHGEFVLEGQDYTISVETVVA